MNGNARSGRELNAFCNFMVAIESLPQAQYFLDTNHQPTKALESGFIGLPEKFSLIAIREEVQDNLCSEAADPWLYVKLMRGKLEQLINGLPEGSYFKEQAIQLSAIFEKNIEVMMKNLGYCCAVYRTVAVSLTCEVCEFDCEEGSTYHSFFNGSFWHTICSSCFEGDEEGNVEVTEGEEMKKFKVDDFTLTVHAADYAEKLVECHYCARKLHQVCINYLEDLWKATYPSIPFTCESCLHSKGMSKIPKLKASSSLPESAVSKLIEDKVKTMLTSNGAGDRDVTVRAFSSKQKTILEPEAMEKFGETGELATEFPHVQRAIYVFLDIDGQDVCIFGMHTKEYGADCPAPNKGKVYISYLDSVKLFEPALLRTSVYYEIILGYFSYLKLRGFQSVHFEASAPEEGVEYIFYRRPKRQLERTIPQSKLVEWYKELCNKGQERHIISGYKDSTSFPTLPVTEVGYFGDGDVWVDTLEELIETLNEEEQKALEDGTEFDYSSRLEEELKEEEIDTLFEIILRKDKEMKIQNDVLLPCEIVSSRSSVYAFFSDSYVPYEFSTVRHAHHSTQALIYRMKKDINETIMTLSQNFDMMSM